MNVNYKRRVCHLTSAHSSRDTRIFLKECSSLALCENYEVYLVAPDSPKNKQIEHDVNILRGVKRMHGSRLERFSRSVYQTYRVASSIRADIYHFHDPELIPVGLILKIKGKKVIYDAHEDLPRQTLSKSYIPRISRRLVASILEILEDISSRCFDAIVTATPHIRDRFLRKNPNTIDINNYPLISEFKNNCLSWGNKESSVCYIGAITEARGILSITEAMSQVQGKLLLGGKFSRTDEQKKASSSSGWANVEMLGYLDRLEVSRIFARSMAGLVLFHPAPNHIDSRPNKMFEYMSSGIPVIASDFPLWREIIEGNNCGLCVNPLDSNSIAQAINWILEHPHEAEKMGRNGREAIEREYNWGRESVKLIELYENSI